MTASSSASTTTATVAAINTGSQLSIKCIRKGEKTVCFPISRRSFDNPSVINSSADTLDQPMHSLTDVQNHCKSLISPVTTFNNAKNDSSSSIYRESLCNGISKQMAPTENGNISHVLSTPMNLIKPQTNSSAVPNNGERYGSLCSSPANKSLFDCYNGSEDIENSCTNRVKHYTATNFRCVYVNNPKLNITTSNTLDTNHTLDKENSLSNTKVVLSESSMNSVPNSSVDKAFVTPQKSDVNICRSQYKRTPPICFCGKRARQRYVNPGGPNEGRSFYTCAMKIYSPMIDTRYMKTVIDKRENSTGCNYFLWENKLLSK